MICSRFAAIPTVGYVQDGVLPMQHIALMKLLESEFDNVKLKADTAEKTKLSREVQRITINI
jgi:hypothetical protein